VIKNRKDSVEVNGSTVKDAVKKALKILGVPKGDVVVKVVSEEKRGLFGMEGEKPAKIKVSLKKSKKNP